MNLPSRIEAYIHWLHASGMTPQEIAEDINQSLGNTRALLVDVKKKAAQIGLRFYVKKKPKAVVTEENNFENARKLAKEAGLI